MPFSFRSESLEEQYFKQLQTVTSDLESKREQNVRFEKVKFVF